MFGDLLRHEWSNYETGECFAEMFIDEQNFERCDEIYAKTEDLGDVTNEERTGFLAAWIDAFIHSKFFDTVFTPEEIELVDPFEIARALIGGDDE